MSSNHLPNRTPHPLTILPSDAPASALDKAIMLPAGDRGQDTMTITTNLLGGPAVILRTWLDQRGSQHLGLEAPGGTSCVHVGCYGDADMLVAEALLAARRALIAAGYQAFSKRVVALASDIVTLCTPLLDALQRLTATRARRGQIIDVYDGPGGRLHSEDAGLPRLGGVSCMTGWRDVHPVMPEETRRAILADEQAADEAVRQFIAA